MSSSIWSNTILESVCSKITDGSHYSPPSVHIGMPMASSKDLRLWGIDTTSVRQISSEEFDKLVKAGCQPEIGDVLLAKDGANCLETSCTFRQNDRVVLLSSIAILRPGPRLDSDFLHYYLQSAKTFMKSSFVAGSAIPRIVLKDLRRVPIKLPPITEQKVVSSCLRCLDDKIELNRRMNNTLEALARALFKSWFGDYDAPHTRSAAFHNSELGDIPIGWRVTKLGDVANIIDCLHSKKPDRQQNGRPLLQLWNIKDDGLMDMSDTYFISEDDYEFWTSRMEAKEGDCVITNVGRVAAVAQIPAGFSAALGRNMTGIRCRREYPYPTYLIQLLMSQSMREEIGLKTDAGTILESLNVRSIPQLRFVLPPREMLDVFEQRCRPLRARMEANLEESRTLSTLRDTVLPKLISGVIRIKEIEKSIGALV